MRTRILVIASIVVLCLGMMFLAYNGMRIMTAQVAQEFRVACPAYSFYGYAVKDWRTFSTKEGAFLELKLEKDNLLVTVNLAKEPVKVFVVPEEIKVSFEKHNKRVAEICIYYPTYAQETIDSMTILVSVLTAIEKEAMESDLKSAVADYESNKFSVKTN